MGSGLAHTIRNVEGMRVRLIADIRADRAVRTLEEIGTARSDIVTTERAGEAEDALASGKAVATEDAFLATSLEGIEANVEATGVPDVGARVAWLSIMARKPVIMLNVETDVTVGFILNRLAREVGSVYTVASGDEPGVCTMLYEQARLMGFEVVCLGKGKNNPLDVSATPESCAAEAASKDMNPKILASFVDGTKTMIEMAAVANATGMVPDVAGMHGPKVEQRDLARVFVPREDGGILGRRGAVDYSTGAIAPGVFAVVYTDSPRIRKDMQFITKEPGPYYLHFRPYHLCDIETPQSIAEAVLLGERTVTARTTSAEVVAVAKRNLKAGERLDGIGGTDFYGRIYPFAEARALRAIPIGLAEAATVTKPVAKGEPLTEDRVQPDATTFVYRLRCLQSCLHDDPRLLVAGKVRP